VQRKQTFPQHQPVRAITHREIAEVRNWRGWLRPNRPARKDVVRNLAQPPRDIHPAEWPQKAKCKCSPERLSLRTPGHIKNFLHSAATDTFQNLSHTKEHCHVRHGGFVLWRIERSETSLSIALCGIGRESSEILRGIVCNPHIGMAFCRFVIIDANGHRKELGPLESATAGVLNNWLERVATGYHLECPAVVVKRATYERLGGFSAQLTYALDLEMWVRIAANAPVYYEPQILAGFRQHGDNQSAIQQRTGANMQDMARAIKIWKDYLPADSRVHLEQKGRRYWADISLMLAQHFFSNDDVAACASQLRAAKALWNHGRHRSRRLRLEAKVLFYRALGRHAITAVRQLRRRIQPV